MALLLRSLTIRCWSISRPEKKEESKHNLDKSHVSLISRYIGVCDHHITPNDNDTDYPIEKLHSWSKSDEGHVSSSRHALSSQHSLFEGGIRMYTKVYTMLPVFDQRRTNSNSPPKAHYFCEYFLNFSFFFLFHMNLCCTWVAYDEKNCRQAQKLFLPILC